MTSQPDWFLNPPGKRSSGDTGIVFYDAFSNYDPEQNFSFGTSAWDPGQKWEVVSGNWRLVEAYPGEVYYTKQEYVWGTQSQALVGGGGYNIGPRWWDVNSYTYFAKVVSWEVSAEPLHYFFNRYNETSYTPESAILVTLDMGTENHFLRKGEILHTNYQDIEEHSQMTYWGSEYSRIWSVDGQFVTILLPDYFYYETYYYYRLLVTSYYGYNPNRIGGFELKPDRYLSKGKIRNIHPDNSVDIALEDGHYVQRRGKIWKEYPEKNWVNVGFPWKVNKSNETRLLSNYSWFVEIERDVDQNDGTFKDEIHVECPPTWYETDSEWHFWPPVGSEVYVSCRFSPVPGTTTKLTLTNYKTFTVLQFQWPYGWLSCDGHDFEVGEILTVAFTDQSISGLCKVVSVSGNNLVVDVSVNDFYIAPTYYGEYWHWGHHQSNFNFLQRAIYSNNNFQDEETKHYYRKPLWLYYVISDYRNLEIPASRNTSFTTSHTRPNNFPQIEGTYEGQRLLNPTRKHKFLSGTGVIKVKTPVLDENIKITVVLPRDKQQNTVHLYFGCTENISTGYCLEYEPYPTGDSFSYTGVISKVSMGTDPGYPAFYGLILGYEITFGFQLRTYYESLVDISWEGGIRRDIYMHRFIPDPCGSTTTIWTNTDYHGIAPSLGWGDPLPPLGTTVTVTSKPWGYMRLYGPSGLCDQVVRHSGDTLSLNLWRDGSGNLIATAFRGNTTSFLTSTDYGYLSTSSVPYAIEACLGDSSYHLPGNYIALGGDGVNIDVITVEKIDAEDCIKLSALRKGYYSYGAIGVTSTAADQVFLPGTLPNCLKVEITGNHADGLNYGEPEVYPWKFSDRLGTFYLPLRKTGATGDDLTVGGPYYDRSSAWILDKSGGPICTPIAVILAAKYENTQECLWGITGLNNTMGPGNYDYSANISGSCRSFDFYYTPVTEWSSSSVSSESQTSTSKSSRLSSSSLEHSYSSQSSSSSVSSHSSSSSKSESSSVTSESEKSSSSKSSSSSYSSLSSESSSSNSSSSVLLDNLIDGRNFTVVISYEYSYYTNEINPNCGFCRWVWEDTWIEYSDGSTLYLPPIWTFHPEMSECSTGIMGYGFVGPCACTVTTPPFDGSYVGQQVEFPCVQTYWPGEATSFIETWTITPAHNHAPTIIDDACFCDDQPLESSNSMSYSSISVSSKSSKSSKSSVSSKSSKSSSSVSALSTSSMSSSVSESSISLSSASSISLSSASSQSVSSASSISLSSASSQSVSSASSISLSSASSQSVSSVSYTSTSSGELFPPCNKYIYVTFSGWTTCVGGTPSDCSLVNGTYYPYFHDKTACDYVNGGETWEYWYKFQLSVGSTFCGVPGGVLYFDVIITGDCTPGDVETSDNMHAQVYCVTLGRWEADVVCGENTLTISWNAGTCDPSGVVCKIFLNG